MLVVGCDREKRSANTNDRPVTPAAKSIKLNRSRVFVAFQVVFPWVCLKSTLDLHRGRESSVLLSERRNVGVGVVMMLGTFSALVSDLEP